MRLSAQLKRIALYPSSPEGTEPLSDKVEEQVWDAGYEAASRYYAEHSLKQDVVRIEADHLFVESKDSRVPHKLTESHPQFWEYLGTFRDGAKAYAEGKSDIEFV